MISYKTYLRLLTEAPFKGISSPSDRERSLRQYARHFLDPSTRDRKTGIASRLNINKILNQPIQDQDKPYRVEDADPLNPVIHNGHRVASFRLSRNPKNNKLTMMGLFTNGAEVQMHKVEKTLSDNVGIVFQKQFRNYMSHWGLAEHTDIIDEREGKGTEYHTGADILSPAVDIAHEPKGKVIPDTSTGNEGGGIFGADRGRQDDYVKSIRNYVTNIEVKKRALNIAMGSMTLSYDHDTGTWGISDKARIEHPVLSRHVEEATVTREDGTSISYLEHINNTMKWSPAQYKAGRKLSDPLSTSSVNSDLGKNAKRVADYYSHTGNTLMVVGKHLYSLGERSEDHRHVEQALARGSGRRSLPRRSLPKFEDSARDFLSARYRQEGNIQISLRVDTHENEKNIKPGIDTTDTGFMTEWSRVKGVFKNSNADRMRNFSDGSSRIKGTHEPAEYIPPPPHPA